MVLRAPNLSLEDALISDCLLANAGNRTSQLTEEATMRAFDCVHEAHEDVHFTAETDEDLIRQIRQHRDQYHTEISDEQIREMVTAGAYDEAPAPTSQ
jgi:chemotaxis regulatin CheY-phosphate phosphatase CheZ